MRISPKQYAILLYELTKDAKETELKEITKSFLSLLLKNRNLALWPRIQLLYQNYYNEQEGLIDIEIITARGISKDVFSSIKESIKAKNVDVKMTIDKKVLGGASIKTGDYMVDDTLKTRIVNLKQQLNR